VSRLNPKIIISTRSNPDQSETVNSIDFNPDQPEKPSFRPERSVVEKPASHPTPQPRPYPMPTTVRGILSAILLFSVISLSQPPAHAQGCTQCRDNTAATPPATQAAYRHAILLMVCTAGGIFLTTLIFFKRHR
jgi:hypothetical protein